MGVHERGAGWRGNEAVARFPHRRIAPAVSARPERQVLSGRSAGRRARAAVRSCSGRRRPSWGTARGVEVGCKAIRRRGSVGRGHQQRSEHREREAFGEVAGVASAPKTWDERSGFGSWPWCTRGQGPLTSRLHTGLHHLLVYRPGSSAVARRRRSSGAGAVEFPRVSCRRSGDFPGRCRGFSITKTPERAFN